MIIYGKQLFLHLLNRHPQKFIRIILAKECEKEIFKKIAATGVKIERAELKPSLAAATIKASWPRWRSLASAILLASKTINSCRSFMGLPTSETSAQ